MSQPQSLLVHPAILLLVLALFSLTATAQTIPSKQGMADQTDAIVQQLGQLTGDNKLSTEQLSQVRTVLQGNAPKFQAVFTQEGLKAGDTPSLKQKITLAREIGKIRAASDAKLATILSSSQMDAFKTIRKEVSNADKHDGH